MITNYFTKATPLEAAEQATRGFEAIRHSISWQKAREKANHLQRQTHEKELAAARQQKCRRKKWEADAKLGLRDPKTLQKIKARCDTYVFASVC